MPCHLSRHGHPTTHKANANISISTKLTQTRRKHCKEYGCNVMACANDKEYQHYFNRSETIRNQFASHPNYIFATHDFNFTMMFAVCQDILFFSLSCCSVVPCLVASRCIQCILQTNSPNINTSTDSNLIDMVSIRCNAMQWRFGTHFNQHSCALCSVHTQTIPIQNRFECYKKIEWKYQWNAVVASMTFRKYGKQILLKRWNGISHHTRQYHEIFTK